MHLGNVSFSLLELKNYKIILFFPLSFDKKEEMCLNLPKSRYETMATIATPLSFIHEYSDSKGLSD